MLQLSPLAFANFLSFIGQDVAWRSSRMCPCANPDTGLVLANCPLCAGKGRIWASPITGKTGVAGQSARREWIDAGKYEEGDEILTIAFNSPLYAAAEGDRLSMINATNRFSVLLVAGTPAAKVFFSVVSLTSASIKVDDTLVDIPLPTIAGNGAVTWSSGQVDAGVVVTLAGTKRPEYFVAAQLPQVRPMHSGALLPIKIVARRFDLFAR